MRSPILLSTVVPNSGDIEFMIMRMSINPVFQRDFKRLKWPRTEQDFAQYRRNLFLDGCAFSTAVGIVIALTVREPFGVLSLILVSLNLIVSFAADVFCIIVTSNIIYHEIALGLWDDLRLTEQFMEEIIYTKYAIATIRNRRITVLIQLVKRRRIAERGYGY